MQPRGVFEKLAPAQDNLKALLRQQQELPAQITAANIALSQAFFAAHPEVKGKKQAADALARTQYGLAPKLLGDYGWGYTLPNPRETEVRGVNVVPMRMGPNGKRQLLLEVRVDDGTLGFLGGLINMGEDYGIGARREAWEETMGLEILNLTEIGMYGYQMSAQPPICYADGEVRRAVGIVYVAELSEGEPKPSEESRQLLWLDEDAIDPARMNNHLRHNYKTILLPWLNGEQGVPMFLA